MAEFSEVKDSGERQNFDTGSVRDSRDGKGRYDLLPPRAVRRLAQHFENGAKKYGDRNWEKGQPLGRYLDSALRHVFNLLEGKTDEDHAAAAAWNLMAFIETGERVEAGELPADLNDLMIVDARPTDAPWGTWDNPLPAPHKGVMLRQEYPDAPEGSIAMGSIFDSDRKFIKGRGEFGHIGWYCCNTGREIAMKLGIYFPGTDE